MTKVNKESKVERIMEKLKHSKYYMTTDLHIVKHLEENGIEPYNIGEHRQHKGIRIYFYGNSSMLRACIYHYYGM